MSIAKMNKVTVIGTKDNEEEILKKLRKLGFFQVEDMSHIVEDEEFKEVFQKQEENNEIANLNQKLVTIEKAISNIRKYAKVKKSMFASKEYYEELSEDISESSYCDAKKLNDLVEQMEVNIQKVIELEEKIAELEPWINFTVSGDLRNINYIKIVFGTISTKYKENNLNWH